MLPFFSLRESFFRDIVKKHFSGISEYHLPSGRRIDVISLDYAIEVEHISKWAESIGQSLVYAFESGKLPCIVFIVHPTKDRHLLQSVLPAIKKSGITVYTIDCVSQTISAV